MASIQIKYHQCGKRNCTCFTDGKLHGPFLWLNSADNTEVNERRERHGMLYLGRTADIAYQRLQHHIPYSLTKISRYDLEKGIEKSIQETEEFIEIFPQRSLSKEAIQIETNYL
ncbi:MAG: DUF6788 family protein [Promethearchaeota archaeon]